MLTHNTHYATFERFVVRYNLHGAVLYMCSNRRLSLDQSKAKVFDSISNAKRFCPFDIRFGFANVVKVSSL